MGNSDPTPFRIPSTGVLLYCLGGNKVQSRMVFFKEWNLISHPTHSGTRRRLSQCKTVPVPLWPALRLCCLFSELLSWWPRSCFLLEESSSHCWIVMSLEVLCCSGPPDLPGFLAVRRISESAFGAAGRQRCCRSVGRQLQRFGPRTAVGRSLGLGLHI